MRSMTLSVTSVRDSENKPRASLCTVGNSPNKGVKLLYVMEMKNNVPLDKRWAKGSRKAICTISFVILQVISGIKA